MITYYVVQSFQRGKKGMLIADIPRQTATLAQCENLAHRLADKCASVIAFSRSGDPETDDWGDAVLIAQHGEMPLEMMEMTG